MLFLGVLQVKEAKGRYIVSHSNWIGTYVASDALSQRSPQFKFAEKETTGTKELLDNSKVSGLLPVASQRSLLSRRRNRTYQHGCVCVG